MQLLGGKNYFIRAVTALIISTLSALLLLLFFSVIVYFTGASTAFLKVINLIIRLVSVCICVFAFAPDVKGIVVGGVLGGLSYVLTGLTFTLLFNGNAFANFLLNAIFSIIFGAIFGIICVNLKNRAKSTWKI